MSMQYFVLLVGFLSNVQAISQNQLLWFLFQLVRSRLTNHLQKHQNTVFCIKKVATFIGTIFAYFIPARKVSKYGVLSGPYLPVFGPEKS